MESLVNQTYAFAVTVVIGVTAGFCYDYYRVVRGVFRLKKVGTCLGDVLFWLVTTAMVFFMLLRGNWGEVRLYVFAGIGLGAFIYYRLFSRAMSRLVRFKFFLFHKTWELFIKALLFLWMVILFPFRLLILALSYPVGFLGGLFRKARQKLKTFFYNLVGRKVEQGINRVKSKLSRLVFWKKKKG